LILKGSAFFSFFSGATQALQVRIFCHDKCFDGACSASLFTRFHRECLDHYAGYEYHEPVRRAGALVGGLREKSDIP
jgi:hypothetical protein